MGSIQSIELECASALTYQDGDIGDRDGLLRRAALDKDQERDDDAWIYVWRVWETCVGMYT